MNPAFMDTATKDFLYLWDNPTEGISLDFQWDISDTVLNITVQCSPTGGPTLHFPVPTMFMGRT